MKNELVDVYAKTAEGWMLIYKNIPEDIATDIWLAGFRTGQNNISIDSGDEEFFKKQTEKLLHKH